MCCVFFLWAGRGTRYLKVQIFSFLEIITRVTCVIYWTPVLLLQVHKMLAEFRLIPGLNNLFDKLIWRKYTASNHVVHGQNENCDCSPV